MIVIWRVDTHQSVYSSGTLDTYMQMDDFRPEGCSPLTFPFPRSTVKMTSKPTPPDFFYAGPVPIASSNLKTILDHFKVPAEYFEVSVVYRGKPFDKKKYYYFNLLDAVECFDWKRSRYVMEDFGADSIEHLVVDESKTRGHHLFRIGQISHAVKNPKAVQGIIYCASDQLATHVIRERISGVVFVEPIHLDDYPPRNVAWEPSENSRFVVSDLKSKHA